MTPAELLSAYDTFMMGKLQTTAEREAANSVATASTYAAAAYEASGGGSEPTPEPGC